MIFNFKSFSSWQSIRAGVPQRSVFGPLFVLIYINDLPQELNSEVNLFAYDTSLFSIFCVNTSALTLNSDLLKTQDWAYQWKMSFNPEQIKQAQEFFLQDKKHNHTSSILFQKLQN